MSYMALYRKFRPITFEDVKGQEHIVTTLKNQIKTGRTCHAYLFCGTRGTGKTTIAKIFARAVNCEHPVEGSPCGICDTCKAIASGSNMDVVEIDAASNNGVDNIREIVDEVSYSPAGGKYKVYIIDEVHMLSLGAFNALLKTLEEPPEYVIFILATTEVHKIPITILSRCQRYDFKRISMDTIADRMKELMVTEQVQIQEKALRYIARVADGSMRDGLSLLDQCIAFHYGQELTYEKVLDVLGAVDTEIFTRLLDAIITQDVTGAIDLLEEIVMQGRELTQFITDFTWYMRNLLLVKTSDVTEDSMGVSGDTLKRLQAEVEQLDLDVIMRYIRVLSELSGQIRYAAQKRVLIEVALIKLCKPSMEKDQESLLDRIRQLEDKIEKGIPLQEAQGQQTGQKHTPVVPKERVPLPKAIPEDVRAAAGKWASVVAQMGNPMKTYLKNARLSLGNDQKMMVVLEDGIAYDYMAKQPEHKRILQDMLSDAVGKEIEVTIQGLDAEQSFEGTFPDISQVIHMEIEEDDEIEEEEF